MKQARRRVVVTGMGTYNPLGNTVDETWEKVARGESGIGRITQFDASDHKVQIAGEIKGCDLHCTVQIVVSPVHYPKKQVVLQISGRQSQINPALRQRRRFHPGQPRAILSVDLEVESGEEHFLDVLGIHLEPGITVVDTVFGPRDNGISGHDIGGARGQVTWKDLPFAWVFGGCRKCRHDRVSLN